MNALIHVATGKEIYSHQHLRLIQTLSACKVSAIGTEGNVQTYKGILTTLSLINSVSFFFKNLDFYMTLPITAKSARTLLSLLRFYKVQVLNHRIHTTEAQVQCQASPHGISSGQSGIGTGFCRSILVS